MKPIKGKYFKINKEFLEVALPLDIVVRKLLIPILFIIAASAYIFGLSYPLFPLMILPLSPEGRLSLAAKSVVFV